MTTPALSTPPKNILSLKGSMTAYALLQLADGSTLEQAILALQDLMADDNGSMRHAPCVMAFPGWPELPEWLEDWCAAIRKAQLIPFAVQYQSDTWKERIHALGLADLPAPDASLKRTKRPSATTRRSVVVRQQVRSGQQIYARDADLIIMAPVSAGAEIMADYNIHVYGPLRGRAMAGVSGFEKAQIFCSSLQAELVAIAGVYMLPEQFPTTTQHVQIHFQDDRLVISGEPTTD
ncbi:septum site-determining protein MinC [Salinispirillum sp. LH 10-3-1]|uniref:Probable septum site-determining protein MinC n=1 Tax=Salinispirillum sp. LH 10-3-1 TaxID=2952525 RepID=A0AB38YI91_9GAMM